MKKIKKLLSLVLVFVVVLSVIPAISVEAKSGVIKKTVKKKFIIEKFNDQDEIDWWSDQNDYGLDYNFSEAVDIVNQCGGLKGLSINQIPGQDEDGVYLDIFAEEYITKAQVAKSLKNMYGKYSCIKKADLKNNDAATIYWIYQKLIKIAKKRHANEVATWYESNLEYIGTYPTSDKAGYILEIAYLMYYGHGPGMDPRVDYKYSE